MVCCLNKKKHPIIPTSKSSTGLLRNRINFLSIKTQLKTSMLLQHLFDIGNSSQLICSINDTRVYDTSTTLEDTDAIAVPMNALNPATT